MKFQCPRCGYTTKKQPVIAARWKYILHDCRIAGKTRELVAVED
jgi:transcription elongation factor Elf1